jgi:hypothetical protein
VELISIAQKVEWMFQEALIVGLHDLPANLPHLAISSQLDFEFEDRHINPILIPQHRLQILVQLIVLLQAMHLLMHLLMLLL